ncbi:MFS transporter [Vreelandella titanicae]|uniref:MFS transporter n=1 Tax=Vreelandella titanicae TaxID=664683 RepID=UPI003D2B5AAE
MSVIRNLFKAMPGDDGLPVKLRRKATLIVVLGTLMAVLDLGAINIALVRLSSDLEIPASQIIWVATTYQLVCAATLLTFSGLGRRWGHRWVFSLGLLCFALGAWVAALSQSLWLLLLGRAFQGLGGAAILSLGPSLYRSIFPKRILGRAIGLNALVVALGLASGPLIGGVILALASWQWIFVLNGAAGLTTAYMAWTYLPKESLSQRGFDGWGALLSVAMMGGFIFAMERLGMGSNRWSAVLVFFSCIAMLLFIWRQRYASTPLVPLSLFAHSRFASATIVTTFAFTGQGAAFVALPIFYQSVLGASPLMAAVLFSPWPLALMLSGPWAGRLADKHDPAKLAAIGLTVFLLGVVGMAWLSSFHSQWLLLLPSLLCGLGYGFFQAPNNREIMGSAPVELSASASGVLASVRTFGQCLGTAMVAIALVYAGGAVQAALWCASGITAIALMCSLTRLVQLRG